MDELKELLTEALRLIAEWQPLPRELTSRLDPAALNKLLAMVRQLRAEGLAGPHHRTPLRLKRMQEIIDSWSRPSGPPTMDQVAESVPGQRAAESLALRQINAQTALDQRRVLAQR